MPWQEMSLMDRRLQFVADYQRGFSSMTELCARAAISRKTGYKWIGRYEDFGAAGLAERSHAPHVCPHKIDAAIAAVLIDARRSHPRWGAREAAAVSRAAASTSDELAGDQYRGRSPQAPGIGAPSTPTSAATPSRHGPDSHHGAE